MYLPDDDLEESIRTAIAGRLRLDVRRVQIERGVNEDGDDTIFVTVVFVENPSRLKRGFMFDLVAATAEGLRSSGEFTPAVVMARGQKSGLPKAH